MAKVIGRKTTVFIGKETTRGTLGTPEYAVPVKSLDVDDVPTYLDNDSSFGVIAEHNDSDLNTVTGEGGYEGKVFDHILGAELRAVFGQAPNTTSAGAGAYKHTFSLANNNSHDSLSIFTKEEQSLSFALGMIDTFSISASLDQYLERSVAFKSKRSQNWDGSNGVAYTRGNEFMARDLGLRIADNDSALADATPVKITSFSLEFAKNLDVQFVFGSDTPDDIQNQQFNLTGSFEYRREDEKIREIVLGNKKKAIRFTAQNKAVTIGGTKHPTIEFTMPYVTIKEDSRSRDNNAVETRTANFQANYSIEKAAIVTAELTNTVAQY